MTALDDLADAFVDDYAALDPVTATYIGVTGFDDRLTDYSPAGHTARAELVRAVLAALEDTPEETDNDRVCAAAMRERLGLELELYEAGERHAALNVIASPVQEIREVFDLMPTTTLADWRTVATRMAAVPAATAGVRASLEVARAAGRVAARRQVLACAEQCERFAGASDGFFLALADRYVPDESTSESVADALRADLQRSAAAASAAYTDMAGYLREVLLPVAPAKDAVGRDRYALWSRYFLGAAVDLEEMYAWGWRELAAITAEMRAVADRITPGGSIDDAVAALDADADRQLGGTAALQAWMQELSDRVVAALTDVHFDIPEPVRRLECRIAPTNDGGIYYTAPSEDFSRPGQMWWSVPAGVSGFDTWREVSTVFHEGVPGHHLQVAQTAYRADVLNRWQRLMCWVSGHGEGWALYAERLMADLGYLEDPGDRLGMLDAQRFRAARVVVDIGMHLELEIPAGTGFHEGERWTPELGYELLRASCLMPEEFLRFELNRYLGWPGQAPSYKIGERCWLAARDAAAARHGAAFDLKAFHRRALDLGSLGLDPLREELALV